jgi:hypothetical protein
LARAILSESRADDAASSRFSGSDRQDQTLQEAAGQKEEADDKLFLER